jgi:hypothetical protein
MFNVKSLHPQCPNALDLLHWMPWFNKDPDGTFAGGHPDQGYLCTDPVAVTEIMGAAKQCGFDGAFVDWYGFDRIENDATFVMLKVCEALDLKFGLVADPGMFDLMPSGMAKQDFLISQLLRAGGAYLNNNAYIKDENGKLLLLEFSIGGVNWPAIVADPRFSQLHIVHENSGFAWWHSSPDNPVQLAAEQNVYIPSAFAGCTDTSSWGKNLNRNIPFNNGQTLLSVLKAIPSTARFIQWVTGNEAYSVPGLTVGEEGTGFLGNILKAVGLSAKYPKVGILPIGTVFDAAPVVLPTLARRRAERRKVIA